MKTVRRPSDSPDEAVAETEAPLATSLVGETSSATIQTEQNALPIVKNVPSWIDKAALTHSDKLTQRSDIGMGYTMYTPNAFDQMVENFSIPSLAQGLRGSSQNSPFTLPFDLHAPNLLHQEPPTLSLSSSSELPAPKTYSFQEKTLGRRLHRACLEAAYHLLHDPSRRPHTFERVFKLSLLSRDRVRMATSVKRILDRGLDEPLDFWDSPTLHIGGAGTHYPDRQRQRPGGHPQREKSKFHLGIISPHMLNMLENIVQSRTAAEVSVEIEGFEGEWFDPYDIEGYLESRGIHIDPTVSLVEAEIDYAFDTAAPNHQPHSPRSALLSTYSSSGGYNSSSLNPTSNSGSNSSNNSNSNSNNERTTTTTTSNSPPWFAHNPEQLSAMQLVEPDLDGWREVQDTPPPHISGLGNVGFSDADTGSWMNFLPPSSSDQYHQNGQAGTRDSGGDFMQNLFGDGSGGDGGGSYGQGAAAAANTMASPTNKKAVIIDVAKFIKGESETRTIHPTFCPIREGRRERKKKKKKARTRKKNPLNADFHL